MSASFHSCNPYVCCRPCKYCVHTGNYCVHYECLFTFIDIFKVVQKVLFSDLFPLPKSVWKNVNFFFSFFVAKSAQYYCCRHTARNEATVVKSWFSVGKFVLWLDSFITVYRNTLVICDNSLERHFRKAHGPLVLPVVLWKMLVIMNELVYYKPHELNVIVSYCLRLRGIVGEVCLFHGLSCHRSRWYLLSNCMSSKLWMVVMNVKSVNFKVTGLADVYWAVLAIDSHW